MINTHKNINEKQETRLKKFIINNLKFDENEKIRGTIEYNYESEKINISPSIKLYSDSIRKNDMKLLKHAFTPSDIVLSISIEIEINYNVLSCMIELVKENGDVDKYEIDRLRLKCNHVNKFPISNGDRITMERIETSIETFISIVKRNNPEIKLQFAQFENNHIIIGTATEEIKKGIHSDEYLIYKSIIAEITPPHHSKTAMMFFPDDSISSYSVVVSITEYDENRKAIKTENETFLVDMK